MPATVQRQPPHRRDSVVLGAAVGLVGITFGVLAEAAGLSLAKAVAMSIFVFTGASQFAAIGVIETGGSPISAIGGALLLAARNGLYGMRLSNMLPHSPLRRAAAAHLVIDETIAMSLSQESEDVQLESFWWTGIALFTFWNLGTVAGVLLGAVLGDPQVWGLDAAFPASFVALLGPHVATAPARIAAVGGVAITVAAIPFTPAGLPILLAAGAVFPALWFARSAWGQRVGEAAQ